MGRRSLVVKMIINLLSNLERQVSKSLKDAGIKTRPVKSNGLWCHTIIPTILILYSIKYKVSLMYKLTTFISLGMSAYSILFIIFMSVSSYVLENSMLSGTTACSFISTLLIYYTFDFGITLSFLMSWPTICAYSFLLRMSLNKFPETFTFGEAGIVIQGIVLSTFMMFAKIFLEREHEFVNFTVFAFILSVIVMVVLMSTLDNNKKNIKNLLGIIMSGALICLCILHITFGRYYLLQFFTFLIRDAVRIKIFSFWLLLLSTSVIVVYMNTRKGNKADTVTRKSFHILGSLVFMTGILFDVELMMISSGLAFGLLIFIEALRKSSIEPFSSILESAFNVYSDEKDIGSFAMTPIYLFVGLSSPLLLVPVHSGDKLELLSGVLAIGIGDTAASWCGKKFGLNKWPGSERTVEGTIMNILSQIITVYLLSTLGMINMPYLMIRSISAACVTGIVEAKLEQVDNLILPLCNILTLQLIDFPFLHFKG